MKTTEKYKSLIESFKQKGITYYTIEVEDNIFFVSDINRNTLKKVSKLLDNKPIQAFNIILKDIFLGGDRNVFDDTDIFLSAMDPVLSTISPYESVIDKTEDNNYKIKILINDKIKKECILKPLTIPVLSDVFTKFNNGDVFGGTEIILDKCWVDGDVNIKTNNKLFLSIVPVINYMMNVKKASIKKN